MKKNLLLAIDIGNTNATIGTFRNKRIISRKFISTEHILSPRQCDSHLKRLPYKQVEACVISGVVPKAVGNIKRICRKKLGKKVFVLGENIKAPIKNRYKKPKQVGQDRLVNGVALLDSYKGGIVVDFGTAVTFDLISPRNEYLGGIIFPGIRLSLRNLSLKAALLPKIKLKPVKALLGKDTTTSMRSGILNGYAALCDGIIKALKLKYGKTLVVVATGGDAPLLAKYCSSIDKVDTDLTLKGLFLTYKGLLY